MKHRSIQLLTALFLNAIVFSFAAAQTGVVPIVEINSRALLGGVENGKWLDPKTTAARLPAESVYRTYHLASAEGEIKYQKPEPGGENDPCEDFYSVGDTISETFGVAIGNGAAWNPVPRRPQPIDPGSAIYKKAVADALRAKGVITGKIEIKQAYRVDLEGDGQEEVLIEATSYAGMISPKAEKGDYSFILLRKIVGKKAQNIVVTGDFITKNVDFGAPGRFQLSAIADLNGDGRMEIVIYGAYYEGIWVETFEMKGNKPVYVKALETGCGV